MKRFFLSLVCVIAAGLVVSFLPVSSRAGTMYVGTAGFNGIEQFTTNGVGSLFATPSVAYPLGLACDSAGNLYVVNPTGNSIAKITPAGVSSVFAADPGDGSVLNGPAGLAFDSAGNLYAINDTVTNNDFIEKFATNGAATRFATDPGDGSVLSNPQGMAFNHLGNLYVVNETYDDDDNFIEEFAPNGTPTTFATDPGDNSELNDPAGMTFDLAGNLYVANDVGDGTIEKFDTSGNASTFASSGLDYPGGMASDQAGHLYVANLNAGLYNCTVVEYNTNGSSQIFGNNMADPYALAFDSASNLFVGDDTVIREFTTNGVNSIYVYTSLDQPNGLALDSASNLYVANFGGETVQKFATNGAASAILTLPGVYGEAFDSLGNLYVSDPYGDVIEIIFPNGGDGIFATDPGNGSVMNYPEGLAIDGGNNVYVVNYDNYNIEKFTPNATPSVFASTGYNESFGPGLAFDKAGYLYAEAPAPYPAGFSIVKFAPNGTPTPFASDPGDGSVLDDPMGMAFDSVGNLYVANFNSSTIEKFTTNGTYSVFASTGMNSPVSIVIQPDLSAAGPTLFITQLGAKVVLSWPVAAGNFGLQSTPGLSSPNWNAVTNIPATVGANYVVTNAITGSAKFYELKSN